MWRHSRVYSRWIIHLWEVMRPDTSISNCALNASCSVFCLHIKCEVKGKRNWMNGKYEEPIFYTSIAVPLHHIMSLCSLEICWLTASHASPPPTLDGFLSLYLSQHICLSPVSLDHCLPHSHSSSSSSPPPSPSFWRVGSSEVVAVCIAKGNVSSTHRKMGQNITTLPAHAQWLTQCWGYMWIRSLCPLISSATRECSHFSLLSFLINYWRHTTAHG